MKTISILNFKGGVGKTSLATNLSFALTMRGAKVLLVDCDRQGNSSSLLPEGARAAPTLTEVLQGKASFNDAIRPARENLDVLPASGDLQEAAKHILMTGMRAYGTLKNAVARHQDYDFILFDHSPSLSSITEAALLASDAMIVPCLLEPYAVEGLIDMINKLGDTLTGLDHEVDLIGIVPFRLDKRYAMTKEYHDSLKEHFGERILHPVRTDGTVSKAQSLGQTVFEYDPRSNAAADFMALASLLVPEEVTA
ncbi:ParA family protein [Thermogemmatispora carboxidivorans]|uniref:ParA family protein n=1 Tax=Thermogemmatispora carboxidivorans TaxID=1382306 RepID=UPI00069BDC1B|nr:ParA family protein [Thermogemmatispora carboxidivorans]